MYSVVRTGSKNRPEKQRDDNGGRWGKFRCEMSKIPNKKTFAFRLVHIVCVEGMETSKRVELVKVSGNLITRYVRGR